MDFKAIEKTLSRRESKPLIQKKKFAVLIPLILVDGDWHILFEMRSKHMNTQPGEISFPGGKMEENETFEETAIRETMEELNVDRGNIHILGELDFLLSSSGRRIVPFLGVIDGIELEDIFPNEYEVDHVFTVPLDYFINVDPDKYVLKTKIDYKNEFPFHLIPNGERYGFDREDREIYFYSYNDYIIWGYTAQMMRSCIDILKEEGFI